MKKVLITLSFFIGFLFLANTASARGIIVYSNGPKYEVKQEIPFTNEEGENIHLGIAYKQFSIFWIPMWNYGDVEYIGINKAKTMSYDLTAEELEYIKEEHGGLPKISFWNRIGGKIIWIGVILLIIWGVTSKKDDEIEGSPEDETTMTQETAAMEEAEEEDSEMEEDEEEEEEESENK